MLNTVALLFIVIGLQQLAFAAMWSGMAWQALARAASLRWACAALLIATSTVLVALRGHVSPGWAAWRATRCCRWAC